MISNGKAVIKNNLITRSKQHGVLINISGAAEVSFNSFKRIEGKGIFFSPSCYQSDCKVEYNYYESIKRNEVEETTSSDNCTIM